MQHVKTLDAIRTTIVFTPPIYSGEKSITGGANSRNGDANSIFGGANSIFSGVV